MKKVLLVIASVLSMVVAVGVVVFVLKYTGVIGDVADIGNPVHVYRDDDGYIYTESSWVWKPVESKRVISYKNEVSVPTRKVTLAFDDYTYYDVTIPDVPCVFDFGKTVWAADGSFMIRVVGGVDISSLSAVAGIDNGENINQYTLRNVSGRKGQRVIATLIGDTAVIVNVYEGDDAFTVLHNSIANNRITYSFDETPYSRDLKVLNEITYSGVYCRSVIVDGVSLYQTRYMFEEGSLWYQGIMKSFEDTCTIYQNKICAFSSSGQIEEVFKNDSLMYARSGEYCVLIVRQNYNTCLAIVGEGEEARCNVVSNITFVN